MRSICYLVLVLLPLAYSASSTCNSYYVRWPRVKLNFKAVTNARLNLKACQSACNLGEDPLVPGRKLECAAMNHHPSPDGFSHQCDVFQPHQLQNVDGYVEADDRYSFYWKYCLNSTRKCGADYAFTFFSDRFMDHNEVVRVVKMSSLEECLTECLEETSFPCRSISFNRTDGGCHLSANSQLTKPGSVKLNNNPNFRIDYYENNCYNMSESFKFEQECREDGVLVKVKSKFPYTGALYGLYDFFTCRIEPKEENSFEYLFPSPTVSKNCSDSIRFKGNEMVLEVVLSTDGVEPLYFITPDDLTYQAKCPIQPAMRKSSAAPIKPVNKVTDTTKQMEASAHALFSMLAKETALPKKETFQLPLTTPTLVTSRATTTTALPPVPSTTTTKATSQTPTTTTSTTTTTTASTTTTTTTPKATTQTTQVNFNIFETNELGEQKDVQPETVAQPNLETNNGVLEISFGGSNSSVKQKPLNSESSTTPSTTDQSTSTAASSTTSTVPPTSTTTQTTTTLSQLSSEASVATTPQNTSITSTEETISDIETVALSRGPVLQSDQLLSSTVSSSSRAIVTTLASTTTAPETIKQQETTTTVISQPQFEPDGSVIQEVPTGAPEPVETFEENKEVMIINGVSMNATKEPLLATLSSKSTASITEATIVTSTPRSTSLETKKETAQPLKKETVIPAKKETVIPAKKETVISAKKETVTPAKKEITTPVKKEAVSLVKKETTTQKLTTTNGEKKSSVSTTTTESPSATISQATGSTETPEIQTSTTEAPKKETSTKGTSQPIQEHLRKMQLVENKARSIIEQEKKVTKPLSRTQKPAKKASRQTRKPTIDTLTTSTVPSIIKTSPKPLKRKPAVQAKPQRQTVAPKNKTTGKLFARQVKPVQAVNHPNTNQTSISSRPLLRSQRRKSAPTTTTATTTNLPTIAWNPTLEHITKLLEKGMPIEDILKSDEINLKDLDVLRGLATTTAPTSSTTSVKSNRGIKKVQNRPPPKQRRGSTAAPQTTTSSSPTTTLAKRFSVRPHLTQRRPSQRQQFRKPSSETITTTTNPTASTTLAPSRRAIAVSRGVVHRREPLNSSARPSIVGLPNKEEKKLPLPRHPSNRGTAPKPKKIKKEQKLFARKAPKEPTSLPIKDIEGDIMAMLLKLSHLIDNQPMTLQKNQLDSERNSKTMTNMKNNFQHHKRRPVTKPTTTSSAPTTTTTAAKTTTKTFHRAPPVAHAPGPAASTNQKIVTAVKEPVSFAIYKDGRPVDGVVVGSKITFAFTPHYPIPADHMSIIGCQSEPVDPKYEWEKEVLPIIKDSCPVDFVGLVCPPSQSEYGLKVVVESFRYQTTPQVMYTCLIRICPFGVCPKKKCPEVEGCANDRHKRALSLEQIREALERDPDLARQFGITANMLTNKPLSLEQQLMALGGDHVVQRRLVVVNSEDQLKYFVNTGDLP